MFELGLLAPATQRSLPLIKVRIFRDHVLKFVFAVHKLVDGLVDYLLDSPRGTYLGRHSDRGHQLFD
jgi:hypothetical protein